MQGCTSRPFSRESAAIFGLAALVASMFACGKSASDKPATDKPDVVKPVKEGEQRWYRVVMNGGEKAAEIPFFLALEQTAGNGRAVIANGDQHVEGEQTRDGATYTIRFPIFHTYFTLAPGKGDALDGQWVSKSPSWGEASIPMRATPVGWPDESKRFTVPTGVKRAPSVSPAGVWEVTFADSGVGKITLTPNTAGFVTAVVHFANGNFVYLTGNLFDRALYLSSFDGTAPYLIKAEFGAKGAKLSGTWMSGQGLDWIETFSGTKRESPDFSLGDTHVPKGKKLGLAELTHPRYQGKPVIVSLSASWCAACKYSTPVLRDLYERYHDRGIEMLMFTYEFTEDEEYNKKQTEVFKNAYRITWEIIPITGDLDSYWDIIPTEITDLSEVGFPMTIFVNADGTVRDVHIGFPGPETGEEYRSVVDKYDRLMRAMLDGVSPSQPAPKTPSKAD